MELRICHDCGHARSDCMRRVSPATRIAGKPPVSQVICLPCANAQDAAVMREAQRLLEQQAAKAA